MAIPKGSKYQRANAGHVGGAVNVLCYFLAILLSALFGFYYDPPTPFTKKDIMRGLQAKVPSNLNTDHRIALGFNANLDIVVDAIELLEAAGIQPPAKPQVNSTFEKVKQFILKSTPLPDDLEVIETESDLSNCFKLYSSKASGVERSISDDKLFQRLVEAYKSEKVTAKTVPGGNAALMGVTLSDLGFDVLLGGQVGPVLKDLLPTQKFKSVGLPSGTTKVAGETVNVNQDEPHIIMEYKEETQWGGWGPKSERANRFIISKDESNAAMVTMEPLVNALESDTKLLVVSGAHLLDAQDETFAENRLNDLVKNLEKVPTKTLIHFELASVGKSNLLSMILKNTLPHVDSLGLNEAELASVYNSLGGEYSTSDSVLPDNEESFSQSIPVLRSVVAGILKVFKTTTSASRPLSRVHFHSFGYHVIATRSNVWNNGEAAVAAGSLIASTKACDATVETLHGNQLDLKVVSFGVNETTTLSIDEKEPVLNWETKLDDQTIHFHLAPVITCKDPVNTVGLGDAISATALGYQLE